MKYLLDNYTEADNKAIVKWINVVKYVFNRIYNKQVNFEIKLPELIEIFRLLIKLYEFDFSNETFSKIFNFTKFIIDFDNKLIGRVNFFWV